MSPQEHADFANNPWQLVQGELSIAPIDQNVGDIQSGAILPFNVTGYTTKPSWGEQTAIDWSNPLTNNLLAFGVLNEGGAVEPIDLVSGIRGGSASNVAYVDDDATGVYLDFTSTNPHVHLNNRNLSQMVGPCAIAVLANLQDTGNSRFLLTSDGIPNDEGAVYTGIEVFSSTTGCRLSYGDGAGAAGSNRRTGIWDNAVVDNVTTMYSWSIPSTGGAAIDASLFVDGVTQGLPDTTDGTGGAVAYSSTIFGKMGKHNVATGPMKIHLYAMWTRVLSDQEHADFANNPWQLILEGSPLHDLRFTNVGDAVYFPKSRGRTTKPSWGEQAVLDWSNPITDGILSYGVINEGGGNNAPCYDLVAGVFGSDANNAVFSDNENGNVYLDMTSTNSRVVMENPFLRTVIPPFSYAIYGSFPSGSANYHLQTADFNDIGTVYSGFALDFNGTQLRIHMGNNVGASSSHRRGMNWSAALNVDVVTMYSITMFAGAGVAIVADLWRDGVKFAAGSGAGSATTFAHSVHKGRLGSSTINAPGNYYLWGLWNRALTPMEHVELAANPYGLLIGPRIREPVEVTVGEFFAPVVTPDLVLPPWMKPS